MKIDEENKNNSYYYNKVLSEEIYQASEAGRYKYFLATPIPALKKDSSLRTTEDGFVVLEQIKRWLQFDGYKVSNSCGNLSISWESAPNQQSNG